MACEKRPFLCGILTLGTLALFFHVVGFAAPGWLIMKLSLLEETRETSVFRAQIIDHGGLGPVTTQSPLDIMKDVRKKRSEEEVEVIEEELIEENNVLDQWITETTIKIKTFEVSTHYGLWYSTMCIHEKTHDDKHKDSSSSDDDDDKKHKKGHCHCRKISTKCALYNSFIYEDPIDYINPGPPSSRVLSTKNFGYASLTEQRVENCLVLAFMVLGLISAIGGFRKIEGCRCAAVMCVLFMLAAALIAIIPVARLSHYSVFKHGQRIPVKVHAPYSAISTGVGAIFALITALVASIALMKKSRQQKPGKWYQFNNELELPTESTEKKPALVFITDPLPEKPGLDDALKEEESEKEAIA
ncbi:uncharacterized protein LOC123549252 [Mercenaria mercenaria]|uniref:uncharacterized protein LOC123549252 n=1 Tax=Mercenaria mercenaria TaxID=6596 RepID=UPI001E1D7124|nr:uncharacterized protein LOC123549252 [Mercenaria mercenaria]